jgi:hypothetical protein
MSHITAIVLLLLFLCHILFVCQIHSTYPQQAHGLQRMVHPHNHRNSAGALTHWMNRRITSSIACQIQLQHEKWHRERLDLSHASQSVTASRKPWDSALTTIVSFLSCGASLSSTFHLVNSISPEDVMTWKSPLRVGYLIAPSLSTIAGIGAIYLHSLFCTSAMDPGQVILGAITSTYRHIFLVLPASILTGWITGSGYAITCLNTFQISLLGLAIFLPMYASHTGGDDW